MQPRNVTLPSHQDLVESNFKQRCMADQQKFYYDEHSLVPSFTTNDKVWLSVPTGDKLQPRWEGEWKVTSVKSPVTIKISNGRKNKVIHSNRLQHCFQAAASNSESMVVPLWTLPQVELFIEETCTVSPSHRYPSCQQ